MDTMTKPAKTSHAVAQSERTAQSTARTPQLYRFHNFRVLDDAGRQVGVADWIWADPTTGQAAFIGIRLNWLLGTARAIPARGVWIDTQTRTLRAAYSAEQIKRAPRFVIRRALTADQENAVWSRYAQQPTFVPGQVDHAGLAA